MQRFLSVIVDKGQKVPDTTVAAIIAYYNSCWGFSYVADGELNIEAINDPPTKASIEEFLGLVNEGGAKQILLSFGRSLTEVPLDSVMPFPLLMKTDGKTILMAGAITGDFTKYADPETNNSDEYLVAAKLIKPYLAKEWRRSKDDFNSFIAELEDDVTRDSFINGANANGTANITLMGANGWLHTYAKNSAAQKLPWGWISGAIGEAEEKKEVSTVVEPARVLTTKEKIALKRALAAGEPPPVLEPVKEAPVVAPASVPEVPLAPPVDEKVVEALSDRTAPSEDIEYELVQMKPPSTLQNKGAKRQWYVDHYVDAEGKLVGHPPNGYKDGPAVLIKRKKVKATQVLTLPSQKSAAENKGIVGKTLEAIKGLASGTPQEEKEIKKQEAIAARAVLPTISMGQEARVREEFLQDKDVKKFTGLAAEIIDDPTKLKESETKFPTFAGRFSPHVKSLADTVNWTPEIYLDLIRSYPEAAVLLMMDYKTNWLNIAKKTGEPLFQQPSEPRKAGAL